MEYYGYVMDLKPFQRYGYVYCKEAWPKRVFFNFSQLQGSESGAIVRLNDWVAFQFGQDPKGRIMARDLRRLTWH